MAKTKVRQVVEVELSYIRSSKEFLVFRRSDNTNSFGLFGMWIVATDPNPDAGAKHDVFEVAASDLNAKQRGDRIEVAAIVYESPIVDEDGFKTRTVYDFSPNGFEIPTRKPSCPHHVFLAIEKEFAGVQQKQAK